MSEPPISDILGNLDSQDADQWWTDFLDQYSAQIFHVVRNFEKDTDNVSDCFQFVCERLVANRFRRLRKFKPNGPAKFSTWLRAVVRNLCLDWHRKTFGRQRMFRSISRLSVFDQEVFRVIYERGLSMEDSLPLLAPQFPNVTAARLTESRERIEHELTAKQRWLMTSRQSQLNTNALADDWSDVSHSIVDTRPNPEELAILNENAAKIRNRLRRLSDSDQLLLRLRFEQELTLGQCAKLLGLGNAQRVDRQLKDILSRLRIEID